MGSKRNLRSRWIVTGLVVVGWALLIWPREMRAQTEGNDAVYGSGAVVTFSPSFIDASQFIGHSQGLDLCDTIYGIFTNAWGVGAYPSAGAVIDARGISGATNLKCTHGTPWSEGSNSVNLPSTILLPATSGATPTPIIISTPWIIPSNTHLIGEGDGIGSSAATTIQVSSTFNTTPGYIMQFGSASGASGISVERLTIDGLGNNAVNGIVNPNAGPNSYVDHVTLYQIRGVGLLVENNADGSGPYSNITFNTGSYGAHVTGEHSATFRRLPHPIESLHS
ncbi:MAG TPA: hypothetical protein VN777_11305 [Terriglobales bacterium]|nr:hypothetical protein [Terriglobales bacterium]